MANYKIIVNNIKKIYFGNSNLQKINDSSQFTFFEGAQSITVTKKHSFFQNIKLYIEHANNLFQQEMFQESITINLQKSLNENLKLDNILNISSNSKFYVIHSFIKYNFSKYFGFELFGNDEIKEAILIREYFSTKLDKIAKNDILFKIEDLSQKQEYQYLSYLEHIKDIFKKPFDIIYKIFKPKQTILSNNIMFKFNFLRDLKYSILNNPTQDIKELYQETINKLKATKEDKTINVEKRLFHSLLCESRTKNLINTLKTTCNSICI